MTFTGFSNPKKEISGEMRYQFQFDAKNKILLLRFEGRLTDELAAELYWAVRKCSITTDARAGIWDLSPVTEFDVSPEMIFDLANREPAMPDATRRPRFIVAPAMLGHGISRLIEFTTSDRNPLLKIVLSVDEALAALGVQAPHFEPLELLRPGVCTN
jgi:hypothetical protein